jgi:hypothetical protein
VRPASNGVDHPDRQRLLHRRRDGEGQVEAHLQPRRCRLDAADGLAGEHASAEEGGGDQPKDLAPQLADRAIAYGLAGGHDVVVDACGREGLAGVEGGAASSTRGTLARMAHVAPCSSAVVRRDARAHDQRNIGVPQGR